MTQPTSATDKIGDQYLDVPLARQISPAHMRHGMLVAQRDNGHVMENWADDYNSPPSKRSYCIYCGAVIIATHKGTRGAALTSPCPEPRT